MDANSVGKTDHPQRWGGFCLTAPNKRAQSSCLSLFSSCTRWETHPAWAGAIDLPASPLRRAISASISGLPNPFFFVK
eukprot:scaffold6206_cov238-Isochrysis_galbana.AAC.4